LSRFTRQASQRVAQLHGKRSGQAPSGYRLLREDSKGHPVYMQGEEGEKGTRIVHRWGPQWAVSEWTSRGWRRLDSPFRPSRTPQEAAAAADDQTWRQASTAGRTVSEDRLCGLLGLFQALYLNHWTTHWQTKGDPFYGDHELFQRLYTGMVEEIDGLAEKVVQQHGSDAVGVDRVHALIGVWQARWLLEPNIVRRALMAEQDFQRALQRVYDDLKEAGAITLGLDDFIMSTASAHETNLYLLQQRLGGQVRQARLDGNAKPDKSEDGKLFNMPKKWEVRELAESGAMTNDYGVATQAVRSNETDQTLRQVRRQVDKTPPTVQEILKSPGDKPLSTLKRYIA